MARVSIAAAALILILTAALTAQQPRRNRFSAYYAVTSATSNAITIQQPATGARRVYFEGAQVYCSVACVATLARDGTAATTTALTEVNVGNAGVTPRANAFRSSNVGAGTTITTLNIAAGQTVGIDLSGLTMEGASTAINFTISVAHASGDSKITIIRYED